MTASNTTIERMSVEDQRRTFDCPSWCIREDHDADVVSPTDPPTHYGPKFGPVNVHATADAFEAVVILGEDDLFIADPADMRRIAAGLLEAAEWIEATR